ncbi:MAG: hypothetical protein AAFU73_12980 [Planctomycetota bacterium]
MTSRPNPNRARAALVAALLFAAELGGTELGVAPCSVAGAAPSQQRVPADVDLQVVEDRHRGVAHPGQPLRLVGFADADAGNDFRQGLRAAARGPYEPALVDPKDAYVRRMAMYEQRMEFHRPLREGTVGLPRAEQVESARDGGDAPERAPYDTTWIGLLLAAGATVAIYVTRGR